MILLPRIVSIVFQRDRTHSEDIFDRDHPDYTACQVDMVDRNSKSFPKDKDTSLRTQPTIAISLPG